MTASVPRGLALSGALAVVLLLAGCSDICRLTGTTIAALPAAP